MIVTDDYTENLHLLENYFANNSGSALYFGVINDEKLQSEINRQIRLLLLGKGNAIQVFSWKDDWKSEHPVQALHNFIADNTPVNGLLLTDLEAALNKKPELLTQLNFAREWLTELNIPLFFWLKKESLSLISQQALDLYDQRIGSPIFYELPLETEDQNHLSEKYLLQETIHSNKSLQQYEPRIKLLQEQLKKAEKQGWSKEQIANDIVIELMEVYVEIPYSQKLLQELLKNYLPNFDLTKAKNCFVLGQTYIYLEELQRAEDMYCKSLEISKEVGDKSNIANTFNSLGILQGSKKEYAKAESSFLKALGIYRGIPFLSLEKDSEIGDVLYNLGKLQSEKKEYAKAESYYLEALEIYRNLRATKPESYVHEKIASTLNYLGVMESYKREYLKAELYYLEALDIGLKLNESNSFLHRLGLASSYVILSVFYLEDKPDKEKSIKMAKKGLELSQGFANMGHVESIKRVETSKQILEAWKTSNEEEIQANS